MVTDLTSVSQGTPWAKRFAWGATITTWVAAVGPAIGSLFGAPPASYDPMVALTALTVTGLVWYTYFTRETLEHGRRTAAATQVKAAAQLREQRESLATAVLAELFNVTERLRNVSDRGPSAASRDWISHPLLDRALENPSLFQPETIQIMAATLRRVRDVQEQLALYPELVSNAETAKTAAKNAALSAQESTRAAVAAQRAEDERATTYLGLRARASWAHNWAVRLTHRLQNEGGRMPVGLDDKPVALFGTVPLAEDPFDRSGVEAPRELPGERK